MMNRRNGQQNRDDAAIPALAFGFELGDALAAADAIEDHCLLLDPVGGDDHVIGRPTMSPAG